MKYHKLIIFFGPDGSGKTTHARLTASHFSKLGFQVKPVWIRAHHTLSAILSNFLANLGYYKIVFAHGKYYKLFDIDLLPGLKNFWGLIEFFSVIPWILIKVNFPLILGNVIIAERYVVDTIVTLAHFLKDKQFLSGSVAKILLRMIPKNALLVHLDANKDVILQRLLKRKDEEVDPDFIAFQQNAYRSFASSLSALTIDTSAEDINCTFETISKRLPCS